MSRDIYNFYYGKVKEKGRIMSVFMWTIVFAISLLVVLLISDDYLLEDIIAFVVKKIVPKVKNLVKG